MHTFQTFQFVILICLISEMRPFLNIVIPPRSNFEAAQPPILIDNGVAVLENEKIERHIEGTKVEFAQWAARRYQWCVATEVLSLSFTQ